MKNLSKKIYIVRIINFIIQFYLMFILLPKIFPVGIIGYILIIVYILYDLMVIREIVSKQKKYKYDFIYDFMQIGFVFYLGMINFKIYYDHIYVVKNTLMYFKVNYIIMTLLLVFIILYSFFELRLRKNKWIKKDRLVISIFISFFYINY